MVSPAMLIVALVIAIAIILFCIIVLKLNASIGMVLASLFMGVAGGLDLMTTLDTISSGFWVATNMSGLTVTGGLKTYTLGSFISSVCIFVLALIGALVIPL